MADKATLYDWIKIEEKELNESVIAISIGESNGPVYFGDSPSIFQDNLIGIDSANDEIMKLLKDEFETGYGSAYSHPYTAWTTNYVIFPTEYDGADGIAHVRRNPVNVATDHV